MFGQVIAAIQRATEHLTVASNECDSAHEIAETLEGHLVRLQVSIESPSSTPSGPTPSHPPSGIQGPDCVNDVARTVFNLAQAHSSADVASASLNEAVTHLKEADTITRCELALNLAQIPPAHACQFATNMPYSVLLSPPTLACRDFASDFEVLESQSRAGAFGQPVHSQEERPDTRWAVATKPVVKGMADEVAALQQGLEQVRSGG